MLVYLLRAAHLLRAEMYFGHPQGICGPGPHCRLACGSFAPSLISCANPTPPICFENWLIGGRCDAHVVDLRYKDFAHELDCWCES